MISAWLEQALCVLCFVSCLHTEGWQLTACCFDFPPTIFGSCVPSPRECLPFCFMMRKCSRRANKQFSMNGKNRWKEWVEFMWIALFFYDFFSSCCSGSACWYLFRRILGIFKHTLFLFLGLHDLHLSHLVASYDVLKNGWIYAPGFDLKFNGNGIWCYCYGCCCPFEQMLRAEEMTIINGHVYSFAYVSNGRFIFFSLCCCSFFCSRQYFDYLYVSHFSFKWH